MRIKVFILIFLSSYVVASTFEDLYNKALQNNLKIKEAKLNLDAKKFAIQKAGSSKYPTISWSGSYQRENIDSSSPSDERLSYNKVYGLNINQSIYNHTLNSDIEKERLNYKIEVLRYQDTLQSVVLELVVKYSELLLAHKKLEAAKKSVELNKSYKAKVDKLFSFSLVTKTDLLKAISGNLEAKLQREMAIREIKIKKDSLESFMRYKIKDTVTLNLNENIINIKTLQSYIDKIGNNFDIQISSLDVAIQKLEINKLENFRMPTVSFVANYSKTNRDDNTYYENLNGKVQIEGKIYSGGYSNAAKKEALLIHNLYKQRKEILYNEIEEDLTNKYFEFNSAKNIYLVSKEQLKTLQSELKFLEKATKIGTKELEELISVQKQILDLELVKFENFMVMVASYININLIVASCDEELVLTLF